MHDGTEGSAADEGRARRRRRHQRHHGGRRDGRGRLARGPGRAGPLARRPGGGEPPLLPEDVPSPLRPGDQLPAAAQEAGDPRADPGRGREARRRDGDDQRQAPLREREVHRLRQVRRGLPRRAGERAQRRAGQDQGGLPAARVRLPAALRHRHERLPGQGLRQVRRGLRLRRHRPRHEGADPRGPRRRGRRRHRLAPLRRQAHRHPRLRRREERRHERHHGAPRGARRPDRREDPAPLRRPAPEAGGLRAVRGLARPAPPAVLLGRLLHGLAQAGRLRPGAVPGRRDHHVLHRRAHAGPPRGLLRQGPRRAQDHDAQGQGRESDRGRRAGR